jgi:hypothetical protein
MVHHIVLFVAMFNNRTKSSKMRWKQIESYMKQRKLSDKHSYKLNKMLNNR